MGKYEYSPIERKALEGSRVPFAVYQFVDKRVVTLILSDGFCDLFGYEDRAKAYYDMDNDMYIDTHPDDKARIAEDALRFAIEGGMYETIYRSRIPGSREYRIIHANGEHIFSDSGDRLAIVWYMNEGKYNTGNNSGETILNQYLSESMHEHSLLRASNYDYLTGLPSMTYFFDLAETERADILRRGGVPVLLFIDLSGMKFYNRKYGFSKGDELLLSFARLLSKYFSNVKSCRVGEDHFAAVSEEEGLEEKLHSLFAEWRDMYKRDALAIRVGVYSESMETVDASSACDRAKYACDSLRNNYTSCISYFDENMLYEASGSQYIIENIDRAIEEGWIVPHYQAIVRSTNGLVCDEEALARWMDPEKGMLSPGLFVPVLEEAGLIYKLDLYMVEQALKKLRTMTEMGYSVNPVSINLSRKDFETCDIIDEICRRVDEAGFDHSILNIEITESTVARDFDYMKEQVERFKSLGFSVWMDDFGSGYSSLDVLQSIPFDLIKFDMHFMQQFDKGEEARIILTELIKMANGLGIDTICEGVEREDQVKFLREIGCSKIQGYYYERPLSFESLLEKFDEGKQIGIENPEEKEYYEALGRINLYDLSMMATKEDSSLRRYFETVPIMLAEVNGDRIRFLRCNRTYKEFLKRNFGYEVSEDVSEFSSEPDWMGSNFLESILECCRTKKSVIAGELTGSGTSVQSLIRIIADNPVTGTTAVAVAVVSENDDSENLTYANIARALAADYFNLFYVDLETEDFIEYTSAAGKERMAVERHGTDFFKRASEDSLVYLHEEDRERFNRSFTKYNVVKALDGQKSFTLDYRVIKDGHPVYVNMKATRMTDDDSHIIIGVSNVNLQMNQRRAIEKLMQDQQVANRIKALTGDFIVMYNIDPETGNYTESNASTEYEGLGFAKTGEDFFSDALVNGEKTIYPADWERYKKNVTKENIFRKIEEEGLFVLKYSLMIDDEPNLVKLRGALVEEQGVKRLIIAVNHISD